MISKKTLDITITGKVQGVWFRKYTQKKAIELGLNGYVENLKDGSVHVCVTGHLQGLDQFCTWCHGGSPLSTVENIVVKEIELDKKDTTFSIKKGN